MAWKPRSEAHYMSEVQVGARDDRKNSRISSTIEQLVGFQARQAEAYPYERDFVIACQLNRKHDS